MKKIAILAATFFLGGCYSLQGSERIMDRDGFVTREVPENSIFRADFLRAHQARMDGSDISQKLVDDMMSSGFSHVYSYCDSYFDVMGAQQRKSRITRDAIAPLSAVITGVIALQNFGDDSSTAQDLLAAVGLVTAASSSVLDIYDEHMLFGAENIGAVETLTKAALSAHSVAVKKKSAVSYDAAVRHLLDNQSICSPQHILTLTREAIKEGKVVASSSTGEASELTGNPEASVQVSVDNEAS